MVGVTAADANPQLEWSFDPFAVGPNKFSRYLLRQRPTGGDTRDIGITVALVSDSERYGEPRRFSMATDELKAIEPPDRRRMVVLTAAFTPMIAVAAVPITALTAAIASIIANVTARWIGIVVLVAAMIGLGYVTARVAAHYQDVPSKRGWRHWLPLVASIVVVGACLAEMVSGSRAPDPVIVLWFASLAWIAGVLPYAAGSWGSARKALWIVAPSVTFVTVIFVWTQGFFSFRFERAVPDLDALAEQVTNGAHVADGTHVGGFEVHYIVVGHIGRNEECDVGMWITGFHADDTRYIAHCVGHPQGDFTHLAGDWWELEGKNPPTGL
jgi:hypothetical protein